MNKFLPALMGVLIGLLAGIGVMVLAGPRPSPQRGANTESSGAQPAPQPRNDAEIARLRDELAEARRELDAKRSPDVAPFPASKDSPHDAPKDPPPAEKVDEAFSLLRLILGRDPTAEEYAKFKEMLADLTKRFPGYDGSALDAAALLRNALGREPTAAELAELYARITNSLAWVGPGAASSLAKQIKDDEAFLGAWQSGDALAALKAASASSRSEHTVRKYLRDKVADPEAFAKWFERKTQGASLSGDSLTAKDEIPEGATIRFGPGVQKWRVSQLGRDSRKPFPPDLLIVGSGRDSTLLSVDEFQPNGDLRTITFQDLTLDCANNYLTDIRGEGGVTIRLERCRIVRFDMGAGGSNMLAAGNAAFYATDTLIECGYGSSPGSGQVFDVRSGALAVRMEHCTVKGPMYGLFASGHVASYYMQECTFVDVPGLKTESDALEYENAEFVRCTFTVAEKTDGDNPKKQLKLTDINPAWDVK